MSFWHTCKYFTIVQFLKSMVFLKNKVNIFLSFTYCTITLVYVVVWSIVAETVFFYILKMFVSMAANVINFHKQSKKSGSEHYPFK